MSLILWHGGLAPVERFRPFSHFGTLESARARLEHKRSLLRQPPVGWLMECTLEAINPLDVGDRGGEHNALEMLFAVAEATGAPDRAVEGFLTGFRAPPRYLPDFPMAGGFMLPGEYLEELLDIAPGCAWTMIGDPLLSDCFGADAVRRAWRGVHALATAAGHDALFYTNIVEDKGEVSYMNLTPDQVIARPIPADEIALEAPALRR